MNRALIILTLIFSLCLLDGQDKDPALFATDITAQVDHGRIILTWVDSPDLQGEVYRIYRSPRRIITSTIDTAESIGVVSEGIQTFTDSPDEGGDWYYLILAEDDKSSYQIAIPHRNSLARAVTVNQETIDLRNAVAVSRLEAFSDKGKILITFKRDRPDGAVSLYRSTQPFLDEESIGNALLLTVLDKGGQSWIDTPIPGIPYYYAALDRNLISNSLIGNLLDGENSTLEPASIPLTEFLAFPNSQLPIRKAPLPRLNLEEYYQELPPFTLTFPPYRMLPDKTEDKLSLFLNGDMGVTQQERKPTILIEDTLSESSPADDRLKRILGEFFLKDRWNEAQEELLILIGQINGGDLKSRIHFYRGQCFFFLGQYEMAYFEFLLSRKEEYVDASQWMEACLQSIS